MATVVEDSELLTIEQLAQRTGLSVRNIRSHVTRGLLPAPHLKGRTGFYGPEHVTRLELISVLQQQGFNLAAVTRLLRGQVAPSAGETVELYRTALGSWLTESPEEWSEGDVASLFGEQPDADRMARLRRLGVLEPAGEGKVRVLNPPLFRVGAQVVDLGFDVEALLGIVDVLVAHSRAVAEAFVVRFLAAHWQPYVDAGKPPSRIPELRAVIEALQPLASQAVVAAFRQAMTESVARAFEQISDQLVTGTPAAG
jgi:DNA-binding transcriptional MerR regulator